MRKRRLRASVVALALTAAVLALGGCANLKPVASYGNKGAELIGQNQQYLKEFYTSTGKQSDYLRRVAVLRNLADAVEPPWSEETKDPALNRQLAERRNIVNDRKKLVQGILALNAVLLNYHQDLTKLAGDETAPSSESVTGLANKSLSLLGDRLASDEKTALTSLAALLVRGLTTEHRRDKLAHLVAEAQIAVPMLLNKEAGLLQEQYVRSLEAQRNIVRFYVGRLVDAADPTPNDQGIGFRNLALAMYWERLLAESQEMEQRITQAGLLAQGLRQLALCHGDLAAFVQDTQSPGLEKGLKKCLACVQDKLDERTCD